MINPIISTTHLPNSLTIIALTVLALAIWSIGY